MDFWAGLDANLNANLEVGPVENGGFWATNPDLIAAALSGTLPAVATGPPTMADPSGSGRKILWLNVLTVVSAAILIGAEVFGAAFAGSWALANLFGIGTTGQTILDGAFVVIGLYVMYRFINSARRVEPFSARQ